MFAYESNNSPLEVDQVRWFYEEHRRWVPFDGYDSLRLEEKYREITNPVTNLQKIGANDIVVVRGEMYEVNINERKGTPVYWIAKKNDTSNFKVIRGIWFHDKTRLPLEPESLALKIEQYHLNLYPRQEGERRMTITQKFTQQLGLNKHILMFEDMKIQWNSASKVYLTRKSFKQHIKNFAGIGNFRNKITRGYYDLCDINDKCPDITHVCFVIHGIGQKRSGNIGKNASQLRTVCDKLKQKYFPGLDKLNQRIEFLPVNWRANLKLDGTTVDIITLLRNKGLRTMVNASVLDILYYTSPRYRHEIIESLIRELHRVYQIFCDRVPYFVERDGKFSVVAHSLGSVLIYDVLTGWSPAQIYEDMRSRKNENPGRQSVKFTKLNEAKEIARTMEFEFMLESEEHMRNSITKKTVPFIVENLFLIGSPLGVFLALRGVHPRPNGIQDDIFPRNICKRVFNVFHQADPVVYRIEPLINDFYHFIDPVKIHRIDNIKKPDYTDIPSKRIHKYVKDERLMEKIKKERRGFLDSEEYDQRTFDSMNSTESYDVSSSIKSPNSVKFHDRNSLTVKSNLTNADSDSSYFSARSDRMNSNGGILRRATLMIPNSALLTMADSSLGDTEDLLPLNLDELEQKKESLQYRIDYRIPESRSANAFLSVLTSHICYWTNAEFCMFLMTQLFGHLGPKGKPL